MRAENLPPSFQKAVLQSIKAAFDYNGLKVHYHFGDVLDVLKELNVEQDEAPFFSLSDILSFVDISYLQKIMEVISASKTGKGTLVFRTFIRNRLTQQQIADLSKQCGTIKDLTPEERSHFYQVFQIEF
jgi:hypothetical protein